MAVVIAQNGYRDTTIKDVAAVAQISLGTFYREFSSKEDAMFALHSTAIDQLVSTIERTLRFGGTWSENIRSAFSSYFRLLGTNPLLTEALVLEFPTLSPEARVARGDALRRLEQLLCRLVDDGKVRHPEVRSRPLTPIVARAVIGTVEGLALSLVGEGQRWGEPEVVDATTEIFWRLIDDRSHNSS